MNHPTSSGDPAQPNSEAALPEWVCDAIEKHESALLRYAQHFVHDLGTAQDVVQDTFLQLCKKQDEDLKDRLAPWLYTVCRNRAIDIGRKERRMKTTPKDQLESQLTQNSNQQSPSSRLEKAEATAGLLQQVSLLPDRQQEVLRLKFNSGLSYQEIAEVTGLTSSNVGFILHTAISKLRQKIGAQSQ